PMAFAAVQGRVPPVAWVLMLANLAWVVAYDTMYAMADREDDLKIGVKSTAILFGRHDRLIIAALQIIALVSLVVAGMLTARGVYYYGGIALAALFSAFQQVLISGRQPADCFRAFLNNTWFGAAVFGGLLLDYL
ncbi:MAG: 4-hydroxybenzoate octaprenyltransferase, partial [Gammaproteobacteria bacterium]